MNAPDNDLTIETGDAALLARVDRVLTNPQPVPEQADTFERLCADLAAAAPQAEPVFQTRLQDDLIALLERQAAQARRGAWLGHLIPIRRPGLSGGRPRGRLVSAAAALRRAGGGIGAYLHQQTPTPVSAQTVLHRAAAVTPAANQATHATYTLSAAGGLTGTADVWVGSTGDGKAPEIALTQTVLRNGQPVPELSARLVENDAMLQVYNLGTNTITQLSAGDQIRAAGPRQATPVLNLEGILIGTRVAQKLTRALQAGAQPNAFDFQQQTLDGASVYALALGPTGTQRYYFDTASYVLEGADWSENGIAWHARLAPGGYALLQLSAVPATTFTLNAPTGARTVVLSTPEKGAKGAANDDVFVAAAAACGTTPDALVSATQSGTTSILAACQKTAPGMTLDQLVTAVVATFKSTFDAQVTSGQLTAADEATELNTLRTKLAMALGGTPGSSPMGKKP